MKRILSALFSGLLLTFTLLLPALAGEADAPVLPAPVSGHFLSQLQTLPDLTRDLAKGLSSSGFSSDHASGAAWNTNLLTDAQLADIANHKKYGVSAIGVSALERPVKAATDGVWANGNVGMALATNRKEKGAMAWLPDGKAYNAAGAAGSGEGYLYSLLLTLNFGKIANLEQFGFISTNAHNLPQAADIYVSDDGDTWTLIGSYDRCAKRQAGQELIFLAAKDLGPDAKPGEKNGGIMDDKGVVVTFVLPEGTKGQFLRIAATALSGVKDDKLPLSPTYADYAVKTDVTNNFRELFVIGALTEDTGAEIDTGTTEPGDTSKEPEVIVKPPKKTEEPTSAEPMPTQPSAPTDTKPGTGSESGTESGTQASGSPASGGCSSSLGAGGLALLLTALPAACLGRRKRK